MDLAKLLTGVRSDRIEFATMRTPGSPFAVLDRRVVVTGPSDLVDLSRSGDIEVIEGLIALLDDPERSWAAEVLLAAMTGHDADVVNSFAATPEAWLGSIGEAAQQRWEEWLRSVRDRLSWDTERRCFVQS